MGTIGDRLGADLMALFGGEGEAPSDTPQDEPSSPPEGEEVAPVPDALVEEVHTSEAEVAPVATEETITSVLVQTIAELSGIPASVIEMDASLDEDLDITGLALWAVVAELERFSGAQFLDKDVLAWKTPADIVAATTVMPTP